MNFKLLKKGDVAEHDRRAADFNYRITQETCDVIPGIRITQAFQASALLYFGGIRKQNGVANCQARLPETFISRKNRGL